MMVELWMSKSGMEEEVENVMQDTSGYEKSGEQLAWLELDDLGSMLLDTRSGLQYVVSGKIELTRTWYSLWSQFLMMISLISLFLIQNSAFT